MLELPPPPAFLLPPHPLAPSPARPLRLDIGDYFPDETTPACYAGNSQMAQTRPLPRICIALGFPDLDRLLEHARREAEAGESFLEFRLDYLEKPERGVEAIHGFLEQHPECI